MEEYLFSYGTLQKEYVQIDLFGRSLKGTADALTGYRIDLIEITDPVFLSKGEAIQQRTIIRTNNHTDRIEGTVFEITKDELLLADEYEPDNYQRIKLKLESGKEAWIYTSGFHLGY